MPGKHCCYGTCRADSRYPDRYPDVVFFPFPKPKTRLNDCQEWIKACQRPSEQLNVGAIRKHHFVCSQHFVEGKPTPKWPYPTRADGRPAISGRVSNRPKRLGSDSEASNVPSTAKKERREGGPDSTEGTPVENDVNFSGLELLAETSQIPLLQKEIMDLRQRNGELEAEHLQLKDKIKHLEHEMNREKVSRGTQTETFTYTERVVDSKVKNLFVHLTGLQYTMFVALFSMLVPNKLENPVTYRSKRKVLKLLPMTDQLLLVLCRLRQGYSNKDLAFRFSICERAVGDIFLGWIRHMKRLFGFLSWWPHRDRIISNMPTEYKKKFPTTLAIIDCTELKTQKPSSLKLQSQCYSDYKSSTTLKSLLAVDPLGNVIYVSRLFTGAISDNEICHQSLFFKYLEKLRQNDIIHQNDAIMSDKGFRIEEDLKKIGIGLNIPPFASSGMQMEQQDVQKTNEIAAHRIHVERRIARIKNFRLVGRTIPTSLFPNINDIWYVVCHLTNFQDLLVKKN